MGRERKKIVFLLFEGMSDYDALYIPISRLYEEIDENIEVVYGIIDETPKVPKRTGGDITSKFGVHPEKIEDVINDIMIYPVLRRDGIYPKDLLEIIQFVDMDGAYVSDEYIIEKADKSNDEVIYSDKIYTNNVSNIIERNNHKRQNIDYLITLNELKVKTKKIKYSVFYSSCNLDHVISENTNMDASLKRDKARQFCNNELSSTDSFKRFFDALMPNNCDGSYLGSWEFIKQNQNSLNRYSNIGVFINGLIERI